MKMTLDPFAEHWGGDASAEEKLTGDVPKYRAGLMCSCSS